MGRNEPFMDKFEEKKSWSPVLPNQIHMPNIEAEIKKDEIASA